MTDTILVTGATGTLGRALVRRLLTTETQVRALSRTPPTAQETNLAWVAGDLRSGAGIDDALTDVDVIIHCATTSGRGDVRMTRNLLAAARKADHPQLIYISIVGIENIPLFYYRDKLEAERLIEQSGLPWTILRATQFHDLVAAMTLVQRWLPVVVVPSGMRFQPVDVRDVAARLAELATGPPAGRVPDLGGPQVRDARQLAQATMTATGRRKPVVSVPIPGKISRGFRAGANLAPEHATGRTTFEQFLETRKSQA